jgi:cell division GTPase FtsZ
MNELAKTEFEKRVRLLLVAWMGGENLTMAAGMIAEMAKEVSDTSYNRGFSHASSISTHATD